MFKIWGFYKLEENGKITFEDGEVAQAETFEQAKMWVAMFSDLEKTENCVAFRYEIIEC